MKMRTTGKCRQNQKQMLACRKRVIATLEKLDKRAEAMYESKYPEVRYKGSGINEATSSVRSAMAGEKPIMSDSKKNQIEKNVRKFMIWENKYGATKAAMMVKEKYGTLPRVYFDIFQDANYHTFNDKLESLYVGSSEDADKEWEAYRKAGGRSWSVFDGTKWDDNTEWGKKFWSKLDKGSIDTKVFG